MNGSSTPLKATTPPFPVLLASNVRRSTVTCFDNTTKSQLIAVGAARRPEPGVAHVKVRSSVSTKTSANVISTIPFSAIVSCGCAEATADRSERSSDTTKSACAGHAPGAAGPAVAVIAHAGSASNAGLLVNRFCNEPSGFIP